MHASQSRLPQFHRSRPVHIRNMGSLAACRSFSVPQSVISLKSQAPIASPRLRPRLRNSVRTQALFGGGGSQVKTGSAYICKDCGYIEENFAKKIAADDKYKCPVCNAPKRRFSAYSQPVPRNVNSTATRKARKSELQDGNGDGGGGPNPLVLAGGGVAALLALYVGLNVAL